MSRKAFRVGGTLGLQCDFMKCNKLYDRTLDATWLNPLLRFRKERKAENLRVELDRIEDQLASRYEGVMLQMLRSSKIATARSIRFIWSTVRRRVVTTSDERTLPKVLWDAYLEQADNSARNSLKPKFMLRQFVDEISDEADRGVLQVLAYGGGDYEPNTTETFRLFNNALHSLHLQLLAHSSILPILTDQVLTRPIVEAIQKPYKEYQQYLLKNPNR